MTDQSKYSIPKQHQPKLNKRSARIKKDRAAQISFFFLTLIPVGLILAITLLLGNRSLPLAQSHPIRELVFGTIWKPFSGQFGFLPFIVGTFWVTTVAIVFAVPPSVLTAFYLSEYAKPTLRNLMKPILDVLAAIPSVVYGVWGVIMIVPFVEKVIKPFLSQTLGFIPLFADTQPTGFSILSGGIVLAVMIIPFIVAIIYEILMTVPIELRQASLALGATRWETIAHVVFPKIIPGIIGGVVLGASRALGETMAVLMVVGNVANIPTSIFDAAYPLPALIANNYGEMMSIPLYDAALLSAALVLLIIVLVFNVLATVILRQILKRSNS